MGSNTHPSIFLKKWFSKIHTPLDNNVDPNQLTSNEAR